MELLKTILDFIASAPYYNPYIIAILLIVGTIVGFINTIAGMATAISYGLFMLMGMPINIANATTRFGVLAQFSLSSFLYKKGGVLEYKEGVKVGIPVGIGSLAGAQAAAIMPTHILELSIGILLPIIATVLVFENKIKSIGNLRAKMGIENKMSIPKFIAFVCIGFYGGYSHAGVGILIIFGSFYMLGVDLLKANGIKQIAVAIYTPIALLVFVTHDQINWPVALIYSIGNITGAYFAAKLNIKYGGNIIKWFVAIIVLTMSIVLICKNLYS